MDAIPTIRVGLWGASAAGKTTFVASLGLCALRQTLGWIPTTIDERNEDRATQQKLGTWQQALLDLRFPTASQTTGEKYVWVLERAARIKNDEQPKIGGRLAGLRNREPEITASARTERIRFEIRDVSGELFDFQDRGQPQEQTLEEMGKCHGFVFLFNPVASAAKDRQRAAFLSVAERLSESRNKYLATCVTKIDDPRVYLDPKTCQLKLRLPEDISYAGPESVNLNSRMSTLFENWAPGIHTGIQTYFSPSRVSFFATSAIGFRSKYEGRHYWDGIDWADFQNFRLVETFRSLGQTGEPSASQTPVFDPEFLFSMRVNSNPNPINVLEPLLWMYERMKAESRLS